MLAEVISIGDELTSGQRLDTNSQWLSERLGELGVKVLYHSTVADDLAANLRVFRQALERVDLVITTGGLGPTADDLTREVLAAVADRPLVQDPASLAHIQKLFARRGRPMPERNLVQALFPQGSSPIPNENGTAPGVDLEVVSDGRTRRVFALPGVPAEMHEMWRTTVAPAIAAMQGAVRIISHRRLKCFGVGESDLEAMLPDLIRRGRDPQVGITVHEATITLRITCDGASEEECQAKIAPTVATIRQCLGNLVFGEDDDELPQSIARLLAERKATLSAVDGGGQLCQWLSEAAGGSFLGGMTAPTSVAMRRLLALPEAEVAKDGEPSSDDGGSALACQAASRCREVFAADYALVLCPFPDGRPQATSAAGPRLAGAVATGAWVKPFLAPFSGHPQVIRPRAVKHALNVLRLMLLEADSQ